MSSDVCLFLWLLLDMCVCRELMDKPIFVSWIFIVYISVYIRAFKSGLGVDSVESLICFSWFDPNGVSEDCMHPNGVSEDCMRKWGNSFGRFCI